MKVKDVPQDDAFAGYRRGDYALDESGRYTVVPSTGWEVERAANALALDAMDREVVSAWRLAREGRRSPLAYHMARCMLTPAVLAQAVGMGRLRVAWHLRPWPFARLSEAVLARYAHALDLPVAELRRLPDEPAPIFGAADR